MKPMCPVLVRGNTAYRFIKLVRDDILLIKDETTRQCYKVQAKHLARFKPLMSFFSEKDRERIRRLASSR